MVLGAHVIFSAYGFWLPNSPGGSWSDFVRRWELLKFGPATKVETRRSIAKQPFNRSLRDAAKRVLMYPPVIFNGLQARALANGSAHVAQRTNCALYAFAILPDHAHLVIGRHHYPIQQLANLLKGGATSHLRKAGLDPLLPFSGGPTGRENLPSPWAHKFWKVWLNHPQDMRRAIQYTNDNPKKAGLKDQHWRSVQPFTR
jgi:REP element-mobilizing transposase RayT